MDMPENDFCEENNDDRTIESDNREEITEKLKFKVKKRLQEPGIIYLSRIPPLMNVKIIRNYFSDFGEIGKIFLQPDDKAPNTKRGRMFSEGWVEFENKKVAKKVASSLNNKQIGGKKKSRWYDEMWSIKYLHRFKWAHLNERLAYERAVHKQRMRTEIAQVKREANFYINNAEKGQMLSKIKERKEKRGDVFIDKNENSKPMEVRQRLTEEEVKEKRKRKMTDKSSKKSKKLKSETVEVTNKKSLAAKSSFINKLFSRASAEEEDDEDE